MNPMPSSTARKPRYDRTIFAGRKNGEVEFMGAKKMYHIKATRKVMPMVTAILLPLGTPSLNVVILGTSIWVVDIEHLRFTFFQNLQDELTIPRPSCDIAFISMSRDVTWSYPDRGGLSATRTSFLDPDSSVHASVMLYVVYINVRSPVGPSYLKLCRIYLPWSRSPSSPHSISPPSLSRTISRRRSKFLGGHWSCTCSRI